jgi:hypothetical protein
LTSIFFENELAAEGVVGGSVLRVSDRSCDLEVWRAVSAALYVVFFGVFRAASVAEASGGLAAGVERVSKRS